MTAQRQGSHWQKEGLQGCCFTSARDRALHLHAAQVMTFWSKAQRVVLYKLKTEMEARKKEVMDKQVVPGLTHWLRHAITSLLFLQRRTATTVPHPNAAAPLHSLPCRPKGLSCALPCHAVIVPAVQRGCTEDLVALPAVLCSSTSSWVKLRNTAPCWQRGWPRRSRRLPPPLPLPQAQSKGVGTVQGPALLPKPQTAKELLRTGAVGSRPSTMRPSRPSITSQPLCPEQGRGWVAAAVLMGMSRGTT